jgi:hypothetical protein
MHWGNSAPPLHCGGLMAEMPSETTEGAIMFGNMKNWVRAAFICAALPLVAACAGGPTFTEMHASEPALAADSGRIYFYRESTMMGAALQPSVKIDGTAVGDAVPGGYFYVDRPAGTYKVSTTTEKEEDIDVKLAAGQIRYVRFDIGMGVFVGHIIPSIIDPDQGANDIKDCHYTGDTKK